MTIENVVLLADQRLGQVTEAGLERGWQRLASRLAQGAHLEPENLGRRRFPWGKLTLAGAVAVAVELGIAACRLWLPP